MSAARVSSPDRSSRYELMGGVGYTTLWGALELHAGAGYRTSTPAVAGAPLLAAGARLGGSGLGLGLRGELPLAKEPLEVMLTLDVSPFFLLGVLL